MRLLLLKLLLPIIAIAGLVNPFYGICVYLGFNIVRPEMLIWGGRSANIIFQVSLLATFFGYLRLRPNPRVLLSYKDFWLLLWVWLASVVSIIMSSYPLAPKAWYYSNELLKLWIVGCLLLCVAYTKEHLMKLQWLCLGCITFMSIWAVQQHFLGNERLEGVGGAAFGDSNGLAAIGVLYFPIALNYFLTVTDSTKKFICLLFTVIIAAMIVFTQSRGGFLGLVAAIVYLFFCTRKKNILILTVLLSTIVAFPLVGTEYLQRLESITAVQDERDYSASSRPVLWHAGLLMFRDNPVFGVGLLNFASAKHDYKQELAWKVDPDLLDYCFDGKKVGHGTYFSQLLAEGGLVLTVPYLWLIGGFLFGAWRIRRNQIFEENRSLCDLLAGMEAGVIGYCTSIIFINALFFYFLPFQLLIGRQLVLALRDASTNSN